MQQEFGDQVTFVGVPSLSNATSMAGFVEDTGTDAIAHIPDVDGVLWNRFGVTEQRTYVFVNDDGTTRTTGYGSLRSEVESLIAS